MAGFEWGSDVSRGRTGGTGYRAQGCGVGHATGGLPESATRTLSGLAGREPHQSANRSTLRLRWLVALFTKHAPRPFRRIRQHIEERAGPHTLKNESAAVLVGFHPVIYARGTKGRFQPQRLVQPFGNIHQHRILAFKKRRFLAHVSLRQAAATAILTILGEISHGRTNGGPGFGFAER